jgi:hypothetical protein
MPAYFAPILLPSRTPELDPMDNVWQYLRAIWPSNCTFEIYAAMAWRRRRDSV